MPDTKPKEARVLVADDDPSILQLVRTIIKREGFAVDCAAEGVEAMEFLEEHDYPVVLLDLMMPRMEGFEVMEWLKTHPPAKKPILLVITAYADQKFKQADPVVVAGALRKPFEVADIGNLVRLGLTGFEDERSLEPPACDDPF